ncbi:MAG: galactokinase [Bacillaceae bacterium]
MVNLVKKFVGIFEKEDELLPIFSPGRVNLIGEHTDYNGGHVFPCALSFGTYAIARKRDDRRARFYSINFEKLGVIECSIDQIVNEEAHNWANYPKGVIDVFQKEYGKLAHGIDVLFYGNIPNGAGLSSSASLELAMSVVLNKMFSLNIDMVEMVKMSQRAENEFIGVNCGIMDQFAIGMGKKNHAILLNCNTLQYRYSPLQLDGYSIVIANTNKRRDLADSKYNERRGETIEALSILKKHIDINTLGDLTNDQFDTLAHHIEDETIRRRAKHAVYENQRTLEAVKALEQNDLYRFGQLMVASHVSLRDDYEVTGNELDTLVSIALKQEGVIGARMTGAGFGGCTVSIVADKHIETFKKEVEKQYTEKIGYAPTFYVASVADGTRKIDLVEVV